jgi:hypothetical protein
MPTCNNLFYIKDGTVIRYTPIGSGGARCYTNDMAKPGFRGAAGQLLISSEDLRRSSSTFQANSILLPLLLCCGR